MGVGGQRHGSVVLLVRKSPDTHCTQGWVALATGLVRCKKSCPLPGIRTPDRPALSEPLYQLSYPGQPRAWKLTINSYAFRTQLYQYTVLMHKKICT